MRSRWREKRPFISSYRWIQTSGRIRIDAWIDAGGGDDEEEDGVKLELTLELSQTQMC